MMEDMEDIGGIDEIDGMEEIELKPDDDSRLIVLIIYDIVDNKRRTLMVKCLSRYAIRVQKSCFEGYLTRKQCEEMERLASVLIDGSCDSLRVYRLRDHAFVHSWGRGEVKQEDVVIY